MFMILRAKHAHSGQVRDPGAGDSVKAPEQKNRPLGNICYLVVRHRDSSRFGKLQCNCLPQNHVMLIIAAWELGDQQLAILVQN